MILKTNESIPQNHLTKLFKCLIGIKKVIKSLIIFILDYSLYDFLILK